MRHVQVSRLVVILQVHTVTGARPHPWPSAWGDHRGSDVPGVQAAADRIAQPTSSPGKRTSTLPCQRSHQAMVAETLEWVSSKCSAAAKGRWSGAGRAEFVAYERSACSVAQVSLGCHPSCFGAIPIGLPMRIVHLPKPPAIGSLRSHGSDRSLWNCTADTNLSSSSRYTTGKRKPIAQRQFRHLLRQGPIPP